MLAVATLAPLTHGWVLHNIAVTGLMAAVQTVGACATPDQVQMTARDCRPVPQTAVQGPHAPATHVAMAGTTGAGVPAVGVLGPGTNGVVAAVGAAAAVGDAVVGAAVTGAAVTGPGLGVLLSTQLCTDAGTALLGHHMAATTCPVGNVWHVTVRVAVQADHAVAAQPKVIAVGTGAAGVATGGTGVVTLVVGGMATGTIVVGAGVGAITVVGVGITAGVLGVGVLHGCVLHTLATTGFGGGHTAEFSCVTPANWHRTARDCNPPPQTAVHGPQPPVSHTPAAADGVGAIVGAIVVAVVGAIVGAAVGATVGATVAGTTALVGNPGAGEATTGMDEIALHAP